MARSKLKCVARRNAGGVLFTGRLHVSAPGKLNLRVRVFVEGLLGRRFLTRQSAYGRLRHDGTFTALVRRAKFTSGICLFAGTSTLASASSGKVKVN